MYKINNKAKQQVIYDELKKYSTFICLTAHLDTLNNYLLNYIYIYINIHWIFLHKSKTL